MEFEVEKKPLAYDGEVADLYREVLFDLERKEFFALDPDYVPDTDGILYLCREKKEHELVGVFALAFPGFDEENLGRDIGLADAELSLVAHMDIAAVRTSFRGHGIQKMLMQMAEKDASALGFRYLMCTIHPDNAASMKSALSLGYEVALTKKKYGGLVRNILLKDLMAYASHTALHIQ